MLKWFKKHDPLPKRTIEEPLRTLDALQAITCSPTDIPADARPVDITVSAQEILWKDQEDRTYPLVQEGRFTIDFSEEAKTLIGRRISRLLPELAKSDQQALLDYTLYVLQILSQDQLQRVRRMVAEELKDSDLPPHDMMVRLAWDSEFAVSRPVLQYSPVLNEQDLIEILKSCPVEGIATAIAHRRKGLSEKVTDRIVKRKDPDAVNALLHNEDAAISPTSYRSIIRQADRYPDWHEALVRRPDLPLKSVNRLASSLSEALIEQLAETHDMPIKIEAGLRRSIRERLQRPSLDKQREAAAHAQELFDLDMLDDAMLDRAIQKGDAGFIAKVLSMKTEFGLPVVQRMLKSGNAKVISAVCWKAGFDARTAWQIQLRIGRLHHSQALTPRQGEHYPVTEEAMELYLDVYRGAES